MEVLVVCVLEHNLVNERAGGGVVDEQRVLERLVAGQHQMRVVRGHHGVPQQPYRVLDAVQLLTGGNSTRSYLAAREGRLAERVLAEVSCVKWGEFIRNGVEN